jgi:hypothetical protein
MVVIVPQDEATGWHLNLGCQVALAGIIERADVRRRSPYHLKKS